MPDYEVTDSVTGKSLILTGDSPPTDDELVQIFESYRQEPPAPAPTGQDDFSPLQVNIPKQNSLVAGNVINQNTKDPESRMILDENEEGRQQLIKAAASRFPQEVVDNWVNSPIGPAEAVDFLDWAQVLPGGGIFQGVEALKILSISNKKQNGEDLTDSENEKYNEFVNKQIEMGVRGFDYLGAGVYYGAPLPAFMAEFAATGGVGKTAQAATVHAITRGVAKTAVQRTVASAAGVAARIATQSAVMVPMGVRNYGEQRIGGLTITETGEALFRESKDTPAMSALKAYAHVSAEVASEISGAAITKYLIHPITKRLRTPLINAISSLPEKLQVGLFTAYQKINRNATVSKVFTAAGWHGMLAELGEERIAAILRETVNLTLEDGYTFDQVLAGITPTQDQLLLEAGLIGAMGGVSTASNITANLLIDKGLSQKEAIETTNNLTATEQDAFVDAELQLQSAVIETELEESTGRMPFTLLENIIENYNNFQEGAIDEIYAAKEKTLSLWKKARTNAARANTPFAKLLAGEAFSRGSNSRSGINVASYMQETGAKKAELTSINKRLGYTLFRAEGGMMVDQITEHLPETEYWDSETDLADVLKVIEQIRDNPKLPAYADKQAELDNVNKEIEILEQTKNEELAKYYSDIYNAKVSDAGFGFERAEKVASIEATNNLTTDHLPEAEYWDSEVDKIYNAKPWSFQEAETSELDSMGELQSSEDGKPDFERMTLDELQSSLAEDYPAISQEEFEASMREGSTSLPEVQPFNDTLIESQTDAAIEAEGITIDPNESMFDKMSSLFFDRFQPLINLAEEAARRRAVIPDGQSTDYLIRQYYSIAGMARQQLEVNTFTINKDGNTVVTGNGLGKILNDFDNLMIRVEPDSKKRMKDLKAYLIARRYWNDLQHNKDIKVTEEQKEATAKDLDSLGNKYGNNLAWFDKTAQEIYDFQTRILRMGVDSGNLSEEQFNKITEGHQNYIPFQRVLDEEFGEYEPSLGNKIFSNATINRIVKKMVGSEREVKDPIDSIIKQTFRMVDMVAQNKVARSMASLSEIVPEYIQPTKPLMEKETLKDGTVQFRPSKQIPDGSIVVFEDGKRKFYKVTPAIAAAIREMKPEQFNFVQKFFQIPATILRSGATIIPEFWVRNIIRDMHGSLILSEARPIPVIDPIKGMVALIGKTELHNKWMQSGGSLNMYMDMSDNGMARAQQDLLSNDGKIARYFKNPLRLAEDTSLLFEQANRIGVFAAAKRKGMSDTKAAFESRDASLDFARGGTWSKAANRYIPFLNAGMQGVNKLYRSMRDRPKATTMWAVGTITMPSIILSGYYLFGAPDDEREEYAEIPQWEKDMFWVFKLGEWHRVPKPFTLGYIFGSVPERFMQYLANDHPNDGVKLWKDLTIGIMSALSPVYDPSALIPPLVKVTMENLSNYNFFKGRNIYPPWMDDRTPPERHSKYTSETAKLAGEALNMSPSKIENALRGTIAGSSQYVLSAGDAIVNAVRKWNGEEIPEKPTSPMDIPLVRAFNMRDPAGSGTSIQMFYKSAKLIKQTNNRVRTLTGEERSQYIEDNRVLIASKSAFNAANKNIRNINKRIDRIYSDLSMSGEEKEEALKVLNKLKLAQAKRANSGLEDKIKDKEDEK